MAGRHALLGAACPDWAALQEHATQCASAQQQACISQQAHDGPLLTSKWNRGQQSRSDGACRGVDFACIWAGRSPLCHRRGLSRGAVNHVVPCTCTSCCCPRAGTESDQCQDAACHRVEGPRVHQGLHHDHRGEPISVAHPLARAPCDLLSGSYPISMLWRSAKTCGPCTCRACGHSVPPSRAGEHRQDIQL